MKRIVAMVAAVGLAVAACGGGDDDTGSSSTAEETAAEISDETAEATGEATEDSQPTDESAEDAPDESNADDDADDAGDDAGDEAEDAGDEADDAGDDQADDGDADGDADDADGDDGDSIDAGPIRSIDDIPEACREQMTNFLQEVEPIVSTIDWQTATFADFEEIGNEFDAISTEFEQQNVVAGCNELDFVDDNEFELMIDFARDEAPGTVGFLEFLDQINGAGTDDADDGSTSGAGFADCEEAIDFVQGLIDDHDSFADVPAAELVKFSSLASIFVTCSPEQLEFFDSPEVNDFLS